MNIRLGRMPWAIGWLFCASFVAASPPSGDELAQCAQQLGAADFAARESAAACLASAGEAAVSPLVDLVCSANPETAWRAVATLQQITLNASAKSYVNILSALKGENARRGNKLAAIINDLSSRRAAERRNMAHVKIRSFGGRFGGDEAEAPLAPTKQSDVAVPAPPPDFPVESKEAAATISETPVLIADAYVSPLLSKDVINTSAGESLTIDQNWRGGDEGLAPLCDLPDLSALNLSRAPLTDAALDTIAQMPAIRSLEIEDTPFSASAIAKFRSRQPRARVVARGANLLEVSAER